MNKTKTASLPWYLNLPIILFLCAMLSGSMFILAYKWEKTLIKSRFDVIARDRALVIVNGIKADIDFLKSIRSFYESSISVEREEFRSFTQSALKEHPEILELRWLKRVTDKERQFFESNTAAEGIQDFHIKDVNQNGIVINASHREEYFPVLYIEPFSNENLIDLGLDAFAVPDRRHGIERARDSGDAALVSIVRNILGLRMYKNTTRVFLPVYKNNSPHETIEDRRANISGLVVLIFNIERLVDTLLMDMRGRGVDTYIYDLSMPEGKRLICFDYSRTRGRRIEPLFSESQIQNSKGMTWNGFFDIADTKIAIICRPAPAFFANNRAYQSWVVLLICIILSTIIVLNVESIKNQSAAVNSLVIKKTRELTLSQAKLRSIFDQSLQFVGLTDTSGTLLEANQVALDFAGVKIAEVAGKPFWETPWWTHSKEMQDKLRNAIKDASNGKIVRFEATHPGKDGVIRYIDFSIKPVKDNNGEILWLVPEGRDITDRIVQENALRDAYQKLREAQAHLLQAERMESLGKVASGVAHEIKNPLMVILQGIDYFEKVSPAAKEDHRKILQNMKRNVKKADDIVSAILNFSVKEELRTEPQDINGAIDRALDLLRYEFSKNKIELISDLGKGMPQVLIDKNKIIQVMVSLLNNAMDIMIAGGKLYIRSYFLAPEGPGSQNAVIEKCWPGSMESAVVVEIEDTGAGMDEDVKKRIFDAFFTTKGMAQGTGLGLAVSKRIVEMHGGCIFVDSEKNKGTKVTLVFKVAGPSAAHKKNS